MEHKFLLGSFHRENGTTFSGIPLFPEIFQWNEPKNHVPFTTQPEFPEFFGKWKTPLEVSKQCEGWIEDLGPVSRKTRSVFPSSVYLGLISMQNIDATLIPTADMTKVDCNNSCSFTKQDLIFKQAYLVCFCVVLCNKLKF